jgi:hypothetical protein
MTDEQNTMIDGLRRLRACEVILRHSIYQSPALNLAHQTIKSELGRLEPEVTRFLPADYEPDA